MSGPDANLVAAAWWHARQSDGVGEADKAGLHAWQATSADRRRAYAAVSHVAEVIGEAASHPALQAMAVDAMARANRRRPRWRRAALVLAVTAAAPLAAVTLHYVRRPAAPTSAPLVVSTDVGRMKRVSLPGGGTLLLDSASRAVIHQNKGVTSVGIVGQAFVSGRSATAPPIVVRAGPLSITPRAAALNIRNIAGQQSVLAQNGSADLVQGDAIATLSAGQSVRTHDGRATIRTVSDPETILGWRHGWLHFDDVAVPAAVAEMNRYRRHPLRVRGADIARMRISGSFRIDESDGFAAMLKSAIPVQTRQMPDGATELIADK